MNLIEHPKYKQDLQYVASLDIPWEKMKEKAICLSGATGLVGSFLIDVINYKNNHDQLNCTIYALSRNESTAKKRFNYCWNNQYFRYIKWDIQNPLGNLKFDLPVDFVLHLASNTHPLQYSTEPIGTILTNIEGTKNMLDFAIGNKSQCMVASSNEIYGENRGDVELFDEKYCGYIDCNTLRAGYPESKRCSEALCQAYIQEKDLNVVIPRLTRSYGPTLLKSDTKALSQFLHKAIKGEDIILKSEGNQFYSYLYVADIVSGLFTILLKGENGEAYNISDISSDIRLKDLAKLVAEYVGRKVTFDLPDDIESKGYSKATKARLDSTKLKKLGWRPKYDIRLGIERTIDVLRETE